MTTPGTHPDPWPLRHLVPCTPRLELRPDDDAGLDELVSVAYAGVHPPEEMPFGQPWTDADPRDMGRGTLQHYWEQRSTLSPQDWNVHFLVRLDGRVCGVQSLHGRDFGVTRVVSTGSWLGLRHQGQGLGTEMRAAVLMFAFDHLGATCARSAAWSDNAASNRVSAKLGYRRDGTAIRVRRDAPAQEVRLLVTPAEFVRPEWPLDVAGLPGCLDLLGVC